VPKTSETKTTNEIKNNVREFLKKKEKAKEHN
jgi:hypothetical protein